jgi:hypothetical protein
MDGSLLSRGQVLLPLLIPVWAAIFLAIPILLNSFLVGMAELVRMNSETATMIYQVSNIFTAGRQ